MTSVSLNVLHQKSDAMLLLKDISTFLLTSHRRLTSGHYPRAISLGGQYCRASMIALVILTSCTVLVSGHRHGVTTTSDHPKWSQDEPSMNLGASDSAMDNDVQQDQWGTLATNNVLQMGSDSIRCATPRPRVLKVQDFHPHAYKRFMPSCVELHRCDRQSGCCDDENNVCSAVKKHKVFMYFFVVALQDDQDGGASVGVHGQVERLRFANHTKCACRKRRLHGKPPLIGQSVSPGGATNLLLRQWLLLAPLAAILVNRWIGL